MVKHPNRKTQRAVKTSDKSIYCFTTENEDEETETEDNAASNSSTYSTIPETTKSNIRSEATTPLLTNTNEMTQNKQLKSNESKSYSTSSTMYDQEDDELTEETLVNNKDDAVSELAASTPTCAENRLNIQKPLVYVNQVELNSADEEHQEELEEEEEEEDDKWVDSDSYFTYNKIRLRIVDSTKIHNESLPLIESFQLLNQNDEISEAKSSSGGGGWYGENEFKLEGRKFELIEYKNVDTHAVETPFSGSGNKTPNNEESEEEIKSISSIEGSLKAGLINDRSLCGNSSSTPLMCLYSNLSKIDMFFMVKLNE